MSDIRFNQWLHNSGTGGVSQVDGGHVGIGTTNPLIPVGAGNTSILNVGVVTANSYYGSGANLTSLPSQLTLSNNADNRVITGGSGTNLNGEANLNFDGTGLGLVGHIDIRTGSSINTNVTGGYASGTLHKNTNSGEFAIVSGGTGGNNHLTFYTSASAAPTEKLRIRSDGKVVIGSNYTGGTLSVTGNLITDDGTNGRVTIQADGTSTNQILSTTTGFGSYCNMKYQAADHIFLYGGTERLRITSGGQVTIGGEVHIGSKLVHDGDTDTHINFSSNTIVTTAGNVTKMNVNNTMVEINGVVQRQGGRQYSTTSTSTWQTILSFSNASANGFSFECAVSENNYTTMYKVGGSPMWNSCYFTSDDAGDSNHAHSSDITFRVLNDSGTKRLQFKAISYTTTRYLIAISVWVRSGYVNWS